MFGNYEHNRQTFGTAKKHNGRILEHNRHKPNLVASYFEPHDKPHNCNYVSFIVVAMKSWDHRALQNFTLYKITL